jgi:hypothetical protein
MCDEVQNPAHDLLVKWVVFDETRISRFCISQIKLKWTMPNIADQDYTCALSHFSRAIRSSPNGTVPHDIRAKVRTLNDWLDILGRALVQELLRVMGPEAIHEKNDFAITTTFLRAMLDD